MVLVGTKKAGNVGAVARACGAFECEDLRLVAPRADPYTRASLSAAKGAQHILRGAGVYDTLEDALLDAGKAVAFHVWIEGFDDDASSSRASESEASEESSSGTFRGRASALETVRDLDELMRRYPPERTNVRSAERRSARDEATEDPTDEDAFEWIANAERERVLLSSAGEARQLPTDPTDDARATAEEGASSKNKTQTQTPGPWRVRTHRTPPANRSHRGAGKLALVFGREVEGLADREVRLCDAACAIPTGRVIESLSVSHAAVISLSRYFEESQRRRRRATTTAGEGEEEEERAEEGGGGGGRKKGFIRGSGKARRVGKTFFSRRKGVCFAPAVYDDHRLAASSSPSNRSRTACASRRRLDATPHTRAATATTVAVDAATAYARK